MKTETEQVLRLGIMGGTFNPIHYGHLMIAENARDQFGLDLVLFLPTGHSPHKRKQEVTEVSLRCEMVSLAIADHPGFLLDTMEADSPEISYTYLTLQKLQERYPNAHLYFIMGADSLFDLEEWRKPEQIFHSCSILAAYRNHERQDDFLRQIQYLKKAYRSDIHSLQTPSLEVSSREIRDRVASHRTIRYLVPREVELYIQRHRLYR